MSIPAYWQEHLNNKIKQINELKAEIGKDCVCFGMITDIHWGCNAHHSGALLTRVMKECGIPYFFNGGDTFSGPAFCSKEYIFQEIAEYREAFAEIEDRCLLVMGNHDALYKVDHYPPTQGEKNISKAELAEHYFHFLKKYPNRTFGDDAYYFTDDYDRKVRYIVLNTHAVPSDEADENGFAKYNSFRLFLIMEEQLKWFAHVALDVPSPDWSVVLCSHENAATRTPKHYTHNHPILMGIINAFQNHTAFSMKTEFEDEPFCNAEISVDYTNKGGNFIAWVSGHDHKDVIEEHDGVVCTITMHDAVRQDGGSYPVRILGTDTEHSFDIFLVDKANRKCKIVRVGYGEDREFSY